jgi:hypothetical protein
MAAALDVMVNRKKDRAAGQYMRRPARGGDAVDGHHATKMRDQDSQRPKIARPP